MTRTQRIQRIKRLSMLINREMQMLEDEYRAEQQKPTNGAALLNKTQAAKYLGVSTRTIHRWEAGGRIMFDGTGRIHRRKLDNII